MVTAERTAAVPPGRPERVRWRSSDRAARAGRLERLRARLDGEGVDAYFGVRPENSRYLTGLELGDREEKVAGQSGWFLVGPRDVVVLADSRYTLQAEEECPDARIEPVYHDLIDRWPALVASVGRVRRVAVEAAAVSHATWTSLAAADTHLELVPAEGWVEGLREVKEPAEVERISAAAAIADAALDALLPRMIEGVTEHELALELEWALRTSGADGLAFDIACLSGPRAALPHGSPTDRALRAAEVVLFDFGARVAGYRSDMTRTLFLGEPRGSDLAVYRLVARAQGAALAALEDAARRGESPTNREIDRAAREVIEEAGHGEHFGHGLGHRIGLATHELPSLGRRVPEVPLAAPTVFSVEPGVYLAGETGVRIEDLVLFDPGAGRLDRLTAFPSEVTVVGAG